ncbi:MAG: CpaD family pilus assembly protein [Hyphomonadaceae bacterium]
MNARLSTLLIGLGALGSLGACAGVPEPEGPVVASQADRHRIEVRQTAERLEIEAPNGAMTLTNKARSDLRDLAGGYLRYGHGALILSTPSGSVNTQTASTLAGEARMALVEAGVSYAAVAGSTYDASGVADAPIIVSFARFEAQAPECTPIYEQDLGHQSNNQAWQSFGCAQQANLAAMLEDPHDLLRPRNEDPRDSGRRTTVLGHYRAGEQTHSERSADERATISNAVN